MQWFCMNRDLDRLDDILAAPSDVMEFCAPLDRESLESQKAVRYAVLHSLTIIGEAASRLTEELRARHGQIPWRRIVAFRHRLVHGYGDVDLDLVWGIARTLVPELRAQVARGPRRVSGGAVSAVLSPTNPCACSRYAVNLLEAPLGPVTPFRLPPYIAFNPTQALHPNS